MLSESNLENNGYHSENSDEDSSNSLLAQTSDGGELEEIILADEDIQFESDEEAIMEANELPQEQEQPQAAINLPDVIPPLPVFKPEITHQEDPFALIAHYSAHEIVPERKQHKQVMTRSDAKNMVIEALKLGNSRYYPLVALLVDHKHLFAPLLKQRDELFAKNQKILLPLKRHQFILTAMTTILRAVKEEVLENSQRPLTTLGAYQNSLIDCIDRNYPHLQNDFKEAIGQFINNNNSREDEWRTSVEALRQHLPLTVNALEHSFYNLHHPAQAPQLVASIDKLYTELEDVIYTVRKEFEKVCLTHLSYQDTYYSETEKYRENLLADIWLTQGNETKAGIPWQYKDRFQEKAQLSRLENTVPLDSIEEETGCNLALLSLQYGNFKIYKKIFAVRKSEAKVEEPNKEGLNASHYEQAYIWQDSPERQKAWLHIESIDPKGQILRRYERKLRVYVQGWYLRNMQLTADTANFFQKFHVLLMKGFKQIEHFEKRLGEAENYLKLVKQAQVDKLPGGLTDELNGILSKTNKGFFNRSQLHKIMIEFLKEIKSDPKYRVLTLPIEVKQQVDLLEKGFQERATRIALEDKYNQSARVIQQLREQQHQISPKVQQQLQAQQEQIQAQQQQMQQQINLLMQLMTVNQAVPINAAANPATGIPSPAMANPVPMNEVINEASPPAISLAANPARFGYASEQAANLGESSSTKRLAP